MEIEQKYRTIIFQNIHEPTGRNIHKLYFSECKFVSVAMDTEKKIQLKRELGYFWG